jgi:hypothetical protein
MQVDPRASATLWAPDNSIPLALLTHGYPQHATQCQEPASTHLSEPQTPGFATLLVPGGFPPHRAWRPSTSHSSWQQESICSPIKEQECQIPHWGEESYNLLLYRQHQKSYFPKPHRSPELYPAPPCRTVTSLLSKRWNPNSSTEWQSTTLLVIGGLPPTVQRPSISHCDCRRASVPHQIAGTPTPHWKEKRGNCHHKSPTRGSISSISLSEEHCWGSRRKKLKIPTTGAQGLKP